MSGTKSKLLNIPDRNKKGVKLFKKQDDESLRRDKITGRWIRHRKTTYLYWYKFLQVCLSKGYKIDRSKYRGWDLDTIVDMRFNDWWDTHKEKLFSVKERTGTPKFQLSTKSPRRESIRMSWLVYFYDKEYTKGKQNNLEIGYKIIKRESINRYLSHSNDMWFPTDKKDMPLTPNTLQQYDRYFIKSKFPEVPTEKIKMTQKIYLKHRSRISKAITDHRIKYQKIIKNVCNGTYP